MPTRTLYLVRHGQEDKVQPVDELGGPLTRLGAEQAYLTSARLRSVHFTNAYVSTLKRAEQTADIILADHVGVAIEKTKMLWECIPSIPPLYAHELPEVSSEDLAKAENRIFDVFQRYFIPSAEDDCNLIVAHGNLIRRLITQILDANKHSWMSIELSNCSVSIVRIESVEKILLVCLNDTCHLPQMHLTY